jgi:hypothetical protein
MIVWAWRWFCWLFVRVVITGALLFTLQTVLHSQGYWISTNNLVISAALIIIGIRCWTGSPENKS